MGERAAPGDESARGLGKWAVPALLAVGYWAMITGITIAGKEIPYVAACLAVGVLIGAGWLVRRGLLDRARLPRTALDPYLLLLILGLAAAVIFSPLPRMGLDRLAWFIFAGVVFYLLVDYADHPARRAGIRLAMMAATALLQLAALVELYAHYLLWWQEAGARIMPPFAFRFTSLVLHPNYFMIIMNLVAPLALVTFLSTGSRAARIFAAFWLVMYALALPFSSSRGGWVGAAGWLGALVLLWLANGGRWKTFLQAFRRWLNAPLRWALVAALGIGLLAAGGLAVFKFYQMFAGSHPSHGSGTSLNRELMWGGAVEIWQSSPWIGSGLGRLGLEYLRVTNTYPQAWWPPHAHSTPLQFLGETGLAGFVPYLLLCGAAFFFFLRAWLRAPAGQRVWAAASLAAFAGAFAHSIFDDFTFLPLFTTFLAANAALLLTVPGTVARYRRLPLAALAVLALAAAAVGGFFLWSYAPLYTITSQGPVSDWPAAASAAAESARRDPAYPYYQSQAGLAYSQAWQQTGDVRYRGQAIQYLASSLETEPYNGLFWADLAVLRWQAGEREQALADMQRAIALCSREPDFYINYGWMLEQLSRPDEAAAQYQQALQIDPALVSHPFWLSSPVRQQAASQQPRPGTTAVAYWQSAQQLIRAGDLAAARRELYVSEMYTESDIARAVTQMSLALAQGAQVQEPAGQQAAARFFAELEAVNWGNAQEERPYNHYFWRRGFQRYVVPGYIRITEDAGQFTVLRQLHAMQLNAGQCEQAAVTWQLLHRQLVAGELSAAGYPAPPQCP